MSYSRDTVAAWAGITRPQINHLSKLRVIRPDVGETRKKLSLFEARMAAVAAAFMRLRINPTELVDLMENVRDQVSAALSEPMPIAEMDKLREIEGFRRQPFLRDNERLVGFVQKRWTEAGYPEDVSQLVAMPPQLTDGQFERLGGEIPFLRAAENSGWCFFVIDFAKPKKVRIAKDHEDLGEDIEGWITLDVRRLFSRIGPAPASPS